MIHHVFANRSNIGDWLSAKGIQHLLGLPVVEHLCDEPFVAATLAALAEAGPADVIVVGGGGLFMDYFEPFWAGLSALKTPARLCIWGVGYCDLKLEPSHAPVALLRQVIAGCAAVIVRDELTRDLLALDLPVVPCPSLAVLDRAPSGHGLLHVDNYTTAGAETYERMDADGRAFAERTGRPYLQTNNRIGPGQEREMQALLDRYAAADVVLSSALHGCIIALAMGRKVVAVSGDRKIEGFMEAAGLGEWVLDLPDVARTSELLERAHQQTDRREILRTAVEGNRAVANRIRALAAAKADLA